MRHLYRDNDVAMEKPINTIFFQLLRCGLDSSERLPEIVSEDDWHKIYKTAQQQSLLGVVFYGLQRCEDIRMPKALLLNWYAQCEQIRRTNLQVNQAAVRLSEFLQEAGYATCILKGQGNTLNYPDAYIRMSGDIDIWVMSKELDYEQKIMDLIRLARKHTPAARPTYHHVDYGKFDGVEVELHYRPSFMNNPMHNHRLQMWFESQAEAQFTHQVNLPGGVGRVSVPTLSFNRIYQMAHIAHHILHEGIGLRQLTDYYLVLKGGFTEEERQKDVLLLRYLGLYDMAGAVMYVLQKVFALKMEEMIVPMDERRGRFVLDEILLAGNFGQYDRRMAHSNSRVSKNILRLKRDVRFLRYFPSECLWEPVFRLWHFFWRVYYRWRARRR